MLTMRGCILGTNYNASTSIVVTFLVLNDPDPHSDHVKKCELWESEYLKVVRAWADENKELATVSFQAEVGVAQFGRPMHSHIPPG